ncbi:hypothetical protein Ae201684P_010565 [Aphanomyces euteiches]|uniref:LNR domain-containing protein n=1 Tax=Aphanomyces euteiches TaxID=100861 RepID=A0A6G0WPA8_9STRA|nr:hypothetical protein Ae201684_013151 [Aphanomyces euteiches]KAH9076625.1 hypothetical protein Ae201684P_010565 [Aphanomyces euteiches]KAH9150120.1 hypothetical protein AeRB84_006985 [Aphanomyces euteiches]
MQIAVRPPSSSSSVALKSDAFLARKWPWLVILFFAMAKHTIIAVYMTIQGILNITQDGAQKRAGYIYNPNNVAIVFFFFSSLHVGSMLRTGWKVHAKATWPQRRRPLKAKKRQVHPTKTSPAVGRSPNSFLFSTSSSQTWTILFNLVEIAGQSYEAVDFAAKVPDRTVVGLYLFMVVLHALLTPLLYIFRHSVAKFVVTNILLSWISLSLSCLIHLFALLVPLLHYKFVNSNLSKDPAWLTKFNNYVQHNSVQSSVDFAAKIVVQLGSLVTVWRLEDFAATFVAMPLDHQRTASLAALKPTAPSKFIHFSLTTYLKGSVFWGVVLFISLIQALWIRQPCPPTCQAALMNLWDSTCQCMLVHVNCVQTNSQDVDSALEGSQLGSNLFGILVSQCDLVDGIPTATLAQFPALRYISVQFTKTKAWNGRLPKTIMFFTAAYNAFAAIPDILQHEIPPSLVILRFAHQPMATPLEIPNVWKVAGRLDVANVSLSPSINLTGFGLVTLVVSGNHLSRLPPSIPTTTSIRSLDISNNAIHDVPWAMIDSGTSILHCGNALDDVNHQERLQMYQTSLVKSCAPSCAPQCFPYMVGNCNCDLACYNAACGFDGGDCRAFELHPSS